MTTEKNIFRDFALANPIKTFTTSVLAVGGLFVLVFFVRIGFMPDVDLTNSTALLSAVALVGLGSLTAFVLVAVLPGVATQYALDESALPPDRWTLMTVAAAGVLLPIVILALVWLPEGSTPPSASYWAPAFIALAVLAIILRVYYLSKHLRVEASLATPKLTGADGLQSIFLLIGSALAWILGTLTALQIAFQFAIGSSHPTWFTTLVISAWMFLVVSINAVTARLQTKQAWIFAPISGFVIFVLLILLTSSFSELPANAIRILGFGEVKNVDLVVKADVCRSMPLTSSTDLRCAMSSSDAVGIFRDVTIRSRIGAQIVVEKSALNSASNTQAVTRLVLKKEDVVMWTLRLSNPAARK